MACQSEDLLSDAACFLCMTERLLDTEQIVLMCSWLNNPAQPASGNLLGIEGGGIVGIEGGGLIGIE